MPLGREPLQTPAWLSAAAALLGRALGWLCSQTCTRPGLHCPGHGAGAALGSLAAEAASAALLCPPQPAAPEPAAAAVCSDPELAKQTSGSCSPEPGRQEERWGWTRHPPTAKAAPAPGAAAGLGLGTHRAPTGHRGCRAMPKDGSALSRLCRAAPVRPGQGTGARRCPRGRAARAGGCGALQRGRRGAGEQLGPCRLRWEGGSRGWQQGQRGARGSQGRLHPAGDLGWMDPDGR